MKAIITIIALTLVLISPEVLAIEGNSKEYRQAVEETNKQRAKWAKENPELIIKQKRQAEINKQLREKEKKEPICLANGKCFAPKFRRGYPATQLKKACLPLLSSKSNAERRKAGKNPQVAFCRAYLIGFISALNVDTNNRQDNEKNIGTICFNKTASFYSFREEFLAHKFIQFLEKNPELEKMAMQHAVFQMLVEEKQLCELTVKKSNDTKSQLTHYAEPPLDKRDGIMYEVSAKTPYTGKFIKYFNDTEKKQKYYEQFFKDGKLDGTQTVWYKNGQVASKKPYTNGKQNGAVISFHDNGQKKLEGSFNNGKKNSVFTDWYRNGQKKSQTPFKNGKIDGVLITWYENGQKQMEAPYTDGKKHGTHMVWHENGKKASKTPYIEGKKDGTAIGFYENGKKSSQISFKNGKIDGIWGRWYRNGQKSFEKPYSYKSGRLNGLEIHWYENGQKKMEVLYKDGKREGLAISWTKNGRKWMETPYKNGKHDGVETIWNENGQKRSKTFYKNGKIIKKENYKNGELVK